MRSWGTTRGAATLCAVTVCAACGPGERAPVGPPLPAPKRLVDVQVSPALAPVKQLVEALVATPREAVSASADELRGWAIAGWMPAEAKRRALFEQIEAATRGAPDRAGAAMLEGRAMEALADDWKDIRVPQCEGDPTMCASATKVGANAAQAWRDRARERYDLCAHTAGENIDLGDFCAAKLDALTRARN